MPDAGTIKLAEENALPHAELQAATRHDDLHGRTDQRGFHVRGRVPASVLVGRILPRREGLELRQNIAHHMRVRVLIDGHRAGRVRREDRYDTIGDA